MHAVRILSKIPWSKYCALSLPFQKLNKLGHKKRKMDLKALKGPLKVQTNIVRVHKVTLHLIVSPAATHCTSVYDIIDYSLVSLVSGFKFTIRERAIINHNTLCANYYIG